MKQCIYSGSFDPITYGHLDIIHRACNTFDKVIVAIGVNATKKYTFSIEERIAFIKNSVLYKDKVEVVAFKGLLADFAYEQNIKTIIKGVRSNQDFDYERLLHEVTITQQAGIDTHILVADQKLSHVSSSAVKELCRHQGLIHEYVPMQVKRALEHEINKQVIIGVTGGIGMGKSYVTELLVNHFGSTMSVLHVDLDKIAHELYVRTEPVYVELQNNIAKEFGLSNVNTVDNRKKLGNIVFNDDAALQKLNRMVRNPILTLMRQKMYQFEGLVLLNGALLVEADFLPLCNNNVVLVSSSDTDQISNLTKRNLSTTQIQRRINSQLTNSSKRMRISESIVKYKYGTLIDYSNQADNVNFKQLKQQVKELVYLR